MSNIVVCFGLPRSGSTWAFNALRMILQEQQPVASIFSDSLPLEQTEWPTTGQTLLVKCHAPTDTMLQFCSFMNARWIACIRDPRDCIVSAMEAFHFPPGTATNLVQNSLTSWSKIRSSISEPLLIRYEDENNRQQICRRLADHVGVSLNETTIERIVESLSSQSVKKLINDSIENNLLDENDPAGTFIPESHWHPNHVGDGQIGKFRERLPRIFARRLFVRNVEFFKEFGYNDIDIPKILEETTLPFHADGALYLDAGFSDNEVWGAWTNDDLATIKIPLGMDTPNIRVEMTFHLSPSFYHENSTAKCSVFIGTLEIMLLKGPIDPPPGEIHIVCVCPSPPEGILDIRFVFDGIESPAEMGISDDNRRIGVGLTRMRIAPLAGSV